MAFENLTPDHALTEKDVVEVLKGGEDGRESLARRARYMAREARCGRDDLIESLMLSARNVREVLPSNRGMPHDRVFETAGELEWMEKERERRIRREMRDLCYAEQTISLIWDAYYRLDPEGRELLQEYCTFGHRNGDWLDFAANTMGVTLGALIGLLMYQLWFKRKR